MTLQQEQIAHRELVGGGQTSLHSHPLSFTSKVRAYNSTLPQTLTKGSGWNKIYLPSKEFDQLNEFDTSLYRFIASILGYYLITGTVYGATGSTSTLNTAIYKNGVLHSRTMINAPYPQSSITDILYLNVNDYIEFYAAPGSSISVPVQIGQAYVWISIARLQ